MVTNDPWDQEIASLIVRGDFGAAKEKLAAAAAAYQAPPNPPGSPLSNSLQLRGVDIAWLEGKKSEALTGLIQIISRNEQFLAAQLVNAPNPLLLPILDSGNLDQAERLALLDMLYSYVAEVSHGSAVDNAYAIQDRFRGGVTNWQYSTLAWARQLSDPSEITGGSNLVESFHVYDRTTVEGTVDDLEEISAATRELAEFGVGTVRNGEDRTMGFLKARGHLDYALSNIQRIYANLPRPAGVLALRPIDDQFLSFIKYRRYNPKTQKFEESRYLGFLVTTNSSNVPAINSKQLGSASDIDSQVNCVLDGTSDARRLTDVSQCSAVLYRTLIEPFSDMLNFAKAIYLSPDGRLASLPFEILKSPVDGSYLTDEKQIYYAFGTRSAVAAKPSTAGRLDAYCAPEFNLDLASRDHKSASKEASYKIPKSKWWPPNSLTPIVSTGNVCERVLSVAQDGAWEVGDYHGVTATKNQLWSQAAPTVLYFATHGFFVDRANLSEEQAFLFELPQMQIGIALAGAERLRLDEEVPADEDNGLLTAYEVTAMDLRNTDLVVLQGCETGLGETSLAEGVRGFREAVRIAGARAVLASLWSVDEDATARLMEEFFRSYLATRSAEQALRVAERIIRHTPGWENPHFWAAFVLESGLPIRGGVYPGTPAETR